MPAERNEPIVAGKLLRPESSAIMSSLAPHLSNWSIPAKFVTCKKLKKSPELNFAPVYFV